MAAEETRFGSGENLANIKLGSTQVEEVYYYSGSGVPLLVWRNNAAPELNPVRYKKSTDSTYTVINAGDSISIDRATTYDIDFTATDLEGDVPFTIGLYEGEDQISSDVTITTNGGSGLIRIPATQFDQADEAGGGLTIPMSLRVVDNIESDGEFEWNIGTLNFDAPSISGNSSVVGSALSYTFNAAAVAAANAVNLDTTLSPANQTVNVSCGGSDSITFNASTKGGNTTKNAEARKFTYSATAGSSSTTKVQTAGCNANAVAPCGFTATTCTDTGVISNTCTDFFTWDCDGIPRESAQYSCNDPCSDSTTNTAYVPTNAVTVTCIDGITKVNSARCTASVSGIGSGVSIDDYEWSVDATDAFSGNGTATINISSGTAFTGTATVNVIFSATGQGGTTSRSDSDDVAIITDDYTCTDANYQVANGIVDQTVMATANSTITANDPSTYSLGSDTYTGTITVPTGYSNFPGSIECEDTATGVANNFTCALAGLVINDGVAGNAVSGSVEEGSIDESSWSPSLYAVDVSTYSVDINIPASYTNADDGTINCSYNGVTVTAPEPEVTSCVLSASSLGLTIGTGTNKFGPDGSLSLGWESEGSNPFQVPWEISCTCSSLGNEGVTLPQSNYSYTGTYTTGPGFNNPQLYGISGNFFDYNFSGSGNESGPVARNVTCTCTWATTGSDYDCTSSPVVFQRSVYGN